MSSKSKAKAIAELDDGGFVPTGTNLRTKMEIKKRLWEQSRIEEEAWRAQQKILIEKQRREREEEERRYNEPLPEFKPQISEEVKRKFFGYVGCVVNDAAFSIYEDWHVNDELGRFKRIPAQSLGAALRVSLLKNIGRISVILYLRIDPSSCDEEQRAICNAWIFRHRVHYRIQKNLFKNIPYFSEFDQTRKVGNPAHQIDSFHVSLWREPDFSLLKKAGFIYPQEKKVVHLEIF